MNVFDGLLTLTAIHFIATASPGSEFMLISKEALTNGRRAGFITLAGTLTGLSIHILYSAFGLAALVAQSQTTLLAIQLLGGSYLIYLGINGLRSKPNQVSTDTTNAKQTGSDIQRFKAGFICDLLNPKAPIYYVALFTFVLSPDMPATELAIYGMCIMAIHLLWFILIVMLLSTPRINRKFRAVGHWIDRVLGGAMVVMGVKVVVS